MRQMLTSYEYAKPSNMAKLESCTNLFGKYENLVAHILKDDIDTQLPFLKLTWTLRIGRFSCMTFTAVLIQICGLLKNSVC